MTPVAQALRDKTAVCGACIIITSSARARDCKKPPVYISGMPVEAAYEDITGDITLVQFRPATR